MLPSSGKISLYEIHQETPSIKPINMKDYMDYYNLSGKVGFADFYDKKERPIKEILIYKNTNNLNFQLLNRRPQTPEMIFNNWGRIKGNLFYANKAEAEAASDTEATAWYLQNGQIYMPLNVEPINGFVSNMEFDSYSFECILSSDHADNDSIGLIPAFHRENNDNYYLCFYANMSGTLPYTGLGISYQGADATHTTWGNSANLLYTGGPFSNASGSSGYGWSNRTVKLKIERQGDIIKFWYSDINSNTLPINPQFTLDLNSDPRLLKFRGRKKYGYMTNSQPNSTYKGIVFQNNGLDEKLIIDSNNKEVYRFNDGSQSWNKTAETIPSIFENKSILLNPEGFEYTEKEDIWYEIIDGNLTEKGKYVKNILPTISKIKSNSQFINPIETEYSLSSLNPISNTISTFQRKGLFKTPNVSDIPISNINGNEITLLPENFEKINITNLDRSTLVMSDSNIFISKLKSINILELYNPKSWYLLNIDNASIIANTTGSYPIPTNMVGNYFYSIDFYNGKYYVGMNNGFMVSEDLENFAAIPEATKDVTNINHYQNYIVFSSLNSTIIVSSDSGETFESIYLGSYSHLFGQLFSTEDGKDYLYIGTQDGNIIKFDLSTKQKVFVKKVSTGYIFDLIRFDNKIIYCGFNICGEISLNGSYFNTQDLNTIAGTNYKAIKNLTIVNNIIYCSVERWGILSSVDGTNWIPHPLDGSVDDNTFFLYNSTLNEFFINFTNGVKFLRTQSSDFESIRSTDLDSQFYHTFGSQNTVQDAIWEEEYQRYLILLKDGTLINYKV